MNGSRVPGKGTLTSGASTPRKRTSRLPAASAVMGDGVAVVDLLRDAAPLLTPAAEHGMPDHLPGVQLLDGVGHVRLRCSTAVPRPLDR
jgi:hypothetical protein